DQGRAEGAVRRPQPTADAGDRAGEPAWVADRHVTGRRDSAHQGQQVAARGQRGQCPFEEDRMRRPAETTCDDPRVALARLSEPRYASEPESDAEVYLALCRAAAALGWSNQRGPLGRVIAEGARVLIKPNFVLHENQG